MLPPRLSGGGSLCPHPGRAGPGAARPPDTEAGGCPLVPPPLGACRAAGPGDAWQRMPALRTLPSLSLPLCPARSSGPPPVRTQILSQGLLPRARSRKCLPVGGREHELWISPNCCCEAENGASNPKQGRGGMCPGARPEGPSLGSQLGSSVDHQHRAGRGCTTRSGLSRSQKEPDFKRGNYFKMCKIPRGQARPSVSLPLGRPSGRWPSSRAHPPVPSEKVEPGDTEGFCFPHLQNGDKNCSLSRGHP